jgi:hypothetical protein
VNGFVLVLKRMRPLRIGSSGRGFDPREKEIEEVGGSKGEMLQDHGIKIKTKINFYKMNCMQAVITFSM